MYNPNATIWHRKGRVNIDDKLKLNGTSQYVDVAYPIIEHCGNQFSVSWFQDFDSNLGGTKAVFSNHISANVGISARWTSHINLAVFVGTGSSFDQLDFVIPLGWHTTPASKRQAHFVLTFDFDTQYCDCYMNGDLIDHLAFTSTDKIGYYQFGIGRLIATGQYLPYGLSNLAVINQKLSQAEIDYIFVNGGVLPESTHRNVIGHWPLTMPKKQLDNPDGVLLISAVPTGAWTSGDFSNEAVPASTSGGVSFRVSMSTTSGNVIIGLSQTDTNKSYLTIEFAVQLLTTSTIRVWESGSNIATFPAVLTDEITIGREGGNMVYRQNGVSLRSVACHSNVLHIDTSYGGNGDRLTHIKFLDGTLPTFPTPDASWYYPVTYDVVDQYNYAKEVGTFTGVTDQGGGIVRMASVGHRMLAGQFVTISGTTNYDGNYIIYSADINDFDLVATFVATESGSFSQYRSGQYGTMVEFSDADLGATNPSTQDAFNDMYLKDWYVREGLDMLVSSGAVHVNIPNDALHNPGTSDFTLRAFAKMDSWHQPPQLMSKYAGSGAGFVFGLTNGFEFTAGLGSGDQGKIAVSPTDAQVEGKWLLFEAKRIGNDATNWDISITIDGRRLNLPIIIRENTLTTSNITTTADLQLGGIAWVGGAYSWDDVLVWCEMEVGGTLVGRWNLPFPNGQTTVTDHINGKDGTYTNFPAGHLSDPSKAIDVKSKMPTRRKALLLNGTSQYLTVNGFSPTSEEGYTYLFGLKFDWTYPTALPYGLLRKGATTIYRASYLIENLGTLNLGVGCDSGLSGASAYSRSIEGMSGSAPQLYSVIEPYSVEGYQDPNISKMTINGAMDDLPPGSYSAGALQYVGFDKCADPLYLLANTVSQPYSGYCMYYAIFKGVLSRKDIASCGNNGLFMNPPFNIQDKLELFVDFNSPWDDTGTLKFPDLSSNNHTIVANGWANLTALQNALVDIDTLR